MVHGAMLEVLIGFGGLVIWGAASVTAQYLGRPRLAYFFALLLVVDGIVLGCLDWLTGGTPDRAKVEGHLLFSIPGVILAIAIFFRGSQMRWVASDPARCAQCNYILTSNATGICPECGEAISTFRSANASLTPHDKRGSFPVSPVKLVLSPESRHRSLMLFFGFVSLSTAIACQLYLMAGDPSSQLARILEVACGLVGVFFAWRYISSKD